MADATVVPRSHRASNCASPQSPSDDVHELTRVTRAGSPPADDAADADARRCIRDGAADGSMRGFDDEEGLL